jgi:hypothetical protein
MKLKPFFMENHQLRREFERAVFALKGCAFWQFWAGGAGSMVSLDAGRKVRIGDPRFKRKWEGAVALFIMGAAWRIDTSKEVVCGSEDSNDRRGEMQKGLKLLVNRRVHSVTIVSPALDLMVEFKGKLFLRVFCNQTSKRSGLENYSLHTTDSIYTVAAKSVVKLERKLGAIASVKGSRILACS